MQNLPEVSIEMKGDLLIATAHGEFEPKWFERLIATILAQAIAASSTAVLFDMRGLTGEASITDRYQMGAIGGDAGFHHPVALVGNEPLMDPGHFGEMVARNRGMNVRVFSDYKVAEDWLNKFATVK